MDDTVYIVFTEGWEEYARPVIRRIFYRESDANAYADELRNRTYGADRSVYFSVEIEEFDVE